jgi:DNA-dependent RNA polymerase auxiliary subunit epsilon
MADNAGSKIVSAIFQDADKAECAYREATDIGYTDAEITVLMSQQAKDRYFHSERIEIEQGSKALAGTGVGGAIGAAVGVIAATIAAVGTTIVLPPLGLVVAGPLAAALAGAGAGGITGGLLGALVGAGIHEDRATVYKTALEKGGIVLTVVPRSESDAEALAGAWSECGGEEIYRS